MKIQKISAYTYTSQKFGNCDDSYNYDWGTQNNQITFKDAITTSAIISGIVLLAGFVIDKGSQTVEKLSKDKRIFHINKLI